MRLRLLRICGLRFPTSRPFPKPFRFSYGIFDAPSFVQLSRQKSMKLRWQLYAEHLFFVWVRLSARVFASTTTRHIVPLIFEYSLVYSSKLSAKERNRRKKITEKSYENYEKGIYRIQKRMIIIHVNRLIDLNATQTKRRNDDEDSSKSNDRRSDGRSR